MNENLIDVNKKLFLYLYRGGRRERRLREAQAFAMEVVSE